MFLSLLILQPMATEIYHTAWEPMDQGKLTASQAFDEGSKPLKTFLSALLARRISNYSLKWPKPLNRETLLN